MLGKLIELALRLVRGLGRRAQRQISLARYRSLKLLYCRRYAGWRTTRPLLNSLGSGAPWIFYDETWLHVVNRWQFRRALARGEAIDVTDPPRALPDQVRISPEGLISIKATADVPDKWFYLYLDPRRCPWSDYSWRLQVRCWSAFKELQLAFRYHDFYNRYRYRFQDGRICFDMVVNGQFYADLSSHFHPLEIGRAYDVEIRALGNLFECWIDGRLVSRDCDPENRFPTGPIAVILWEDDGVTEIRAEIAMQVVLGLSKAPGSIAAV